MKIVYFNYLYDLFEGSLGSTIKAMELMSALEKRGHEVKSFWLNARPNTNGQSLINIRHHLKSRFDKYLHEPNQILKNLRYIHNENRIIKEEAPDLIISRLDVYLFSTLFLTKQKNIPWLLEADAPAVYESRHFFTRYKKLPYIDSFIEKLNVRGADNIIVVSDQARKYFLKYEIPDDKIFVVPNGVDIAKFNPDVKGDDVIKRFKLKDKIVVGFVGSMHYWHGVSNLIKVMDGILSSKQNVLFLVLGEGGANEVELKNFIEEKGYHERLVSPGLVPHNEVPTFIKAMDIVLAPYPQLDFFYYSPMKIYEYLACGKAVVASRLGQIEEVIKDKVNGMLCEPGNIQQMIRKTAELVDNDELRTSIGKQAWESIAKYHTWDTRAQIISGICKTMISSNGEFKPDSVLRQANHHPSGDSATR